MSLPEISKEPDFEELFRDKNLFEVFWTSPTIFANRFNSIVTSSTAIFLLSFAIYRMNIKTNIPHPPFSTIFVGWAGIGWTLSSTLLGFLIAGFALFCTVLQPGTVVRLHSMHMDGEKNSVLRNLFIFFVDILVQYLSLLFFSLLVIIVSSTGGPILEIKQVIGCLGARACEYFGYAVFVAWSIWYVVLLLKLKSFVYNLYQALLIGMTDKVHNPEQSDNDEQVR